MSETRSNRQKYWDGLAEKIWQATQRPQPPVTKEEIASLIIEHVETKAMDVSDEWTASKYTTFEAPLDGGDIIIPLIGQTRKTAAERLEAGDPVVIRDGVAKVIDDVRQMRADAEALASKPNFLKD